MIYLYSVTYVLILVVVGAIGGFHVGHYVFLERHKLTKYFSYPGWIISVGIVFILAAVFGELGVGKEAASGSGYIVLILSFIFFYRLSIKPDEKLRIKLKSK